MALLVYLCWKLPNIRIVHFLIDNISITTSSDLLTKPLPLRTLKLISHSHLKLLVQSKMSDALDRLIAVSIFRREPTKALGTQFVIRFLNSFLV